MSTPPTAAPPRVVPPRNPNADVSILVSEMESWFKVLKQAHVGFSTLSGSYQSASGHVPEGERKKGLPILEYSGVLEGKESREVVKCSADLKKANPAYLGHVLLPLINIHAGEVFEALEEIETRVELLKPLLAAVMGGPTPQSTDSPP